MNNGTKSVHDPVGSHTLEVIAKAGHFNKWVYEQFSGYLKGDILEIGSGIGNISQFVINNGCHITLSDLNEEYCFRLKRRYAENNLVDNILQIDLLDPDFSNKYKDITEKFDCIFLLNVIEHIEDDSKAIQNCSFLLKPGGHLIVLAPAWQWLYCKLDKELGHYRRYTIKTMTALLGDNHFRILNKKYFNVLGLFGWLVSGKILRNKMLGKNEMSFFDKLVYPARLMDKIVFSKTGLSVIVTGKKPI